MVVVIATSSFTLAVPLLHMLAFVCATPTHARVGLCRPFRGGAYGTINAAAGHVIHEGRWIADTTVMDGEIRFWFGGHHYANGSVSVIRLTSVISLIPAVCCIALVSRGHYVASRHNQGVVSLTEQ